MDKENMCCSVVLMVSINVAFLSTIAITFHLQCNLIISMNWMILKIKYRIPFSSLHYTNQLNYFSNLSFSSCDLERVIWRSRGVQSLSKTSGQYSDLSIDHRILYCMHCRRNRIQCLLLQRYRKAEASWQGNSFL